MVLFSINLTMPIRELILYFQLDWTIAQVDLTAQLICDMLVIWMDVLFALLVVLTWSWDTVVIDLGLIDMLGVLFVERLDDVGG